MKTKIYKSAFTLVEATLVLVIIGVISVIMLENLNPRAIQEDAIKKLSEATLINIEFATREILAKDTYNYNLDKLYDSGTVFSISNSGKETNLLNLYSKYFKTSRKSALSSKYKSNTLVSSAGTQVSGLSVGGFTNGIFIKNGVYFTVKMYGKCTQNVTYIYNPAYPDNHSYTNVCAIIFYDVNGESAPNVLGIDQNILALGKLGIK